LPRATILSASSESGRCSSSASFYGAVNQSKISSQIVRITGIAFGWIGATTAFRSVVSNRARACGGVPVLQGTAIRISIR
jgi:hypothetical protein